jgi:DNA polymerase-3 subunit epsilon
MSDILIFDVETTGIKPERDQIIELCIQVGLKTDSPSKTWRFKPSVPISPAAEKVHGISMKDLVDCPPFASAVNEIREYFEKADVIVGYNVEFDISFLQAELQRIEQAPILLNKKSVVDPYVIWRKSEPRNLASAYERFVGKTMSNAHAAQDDVSATGEVLEGMLASFNMSDMSWGKLGEFCQSSRSQWIGPTYHFQWKENRVVFGFGKHKDRPLQDVLEEDDGGYAAWLMRSDFPNHVKTIIKETPNRSQSELESWIKEEFED